MYLHDVGKQVKDYTEALEYLKAGNRRYWEGKLCSKDAYEQDRDILVEGQSPFAAILTCSDSRVAPEIYFDQMLGDVFIIRNAGNIVDVTALGSIKYATEYLHVPLVVVCGHTGCGAIQAALVNDDYPESLAMIIGAIKEGIGNAADRTQAVYKNIEHGVNIIKTNATIKEGNVYVVGACYDIETGKVTWME